MPPTSKKLKGHIGFELSVHPSVFRIVRTVILVCSDSNPVYSRGDRVKNL